MFNIIIEDGLDHREIDCVMTVLNAETPKEAIEIAMKQRPDIFLSKTIHSSGGNASVIGSKFCTWVYAYPLKTTV